MNWTSLAVAAASVAVLSTAAQAAEVAARHGLDSAGYQQEFDAISGQGYRIKHVDGYATPDGVKYAAIWIKSASNRPYIARHGLNQSQFQTEFNKAASGGFRLMEISATDGGLYSGIWEKGGGPAWESRSGLNGAAFTAKFKQMADDGFRMTDLEGYQDGGETRFAGIWVKNDGRGWYAWRDMSSSDYQAKFNEMSAQGFRPVHVDGYGTPNGQRFAAIFEKKPGAFVARHDLTSAQYQAEYEKNAGNGFHLVEVSGYSDGSQTRYAALWEK